MKNFKIKSIFFSLMAIAMVTVFLTSCNKDLALKQDDESILKKVLLTDEIANFNEQIHGSLIIEEAFLAQKIDNEEGNPSISLVTIPINDGIKNQVKSLDIAYDHEQQTFEFEVMEITYADKFIEEAQKHADIIELRDEDIDTRNIKYSANHKFYNLDGFLYAEQVFDNNELVLDFEDLSRGWTSCMFYCVKDKMGWKDYIKCGWYVGTCAVTKSLSQCLKALKNCLGAKYWWDCNKKC